MQFQADILNIKISRPENIETTALGVALLAGLSVKFWTSPNDFKNIIKINKNFVSSINSKNRSSLLSGWKETISKTLTRKKRKIGREKAARKKIYEARRSNVA